MSIKVCGNVVIPNQSGNANNNLALGATSGLGAITTGTDNIAIGNGAGQYVSEGANNNFLGSAAGNYNTTGNNNNFFGFCTGYNNTSGSCNTFIGESAGKNNTSGNCNNFIGALAGFSNGNGSNNNFFGQGAGKFLNGSYNVNIFGSYEGSGAASPGNPTDVSGYTFIGGTNLSSGLTINNNNAIAFGGGSDGTFPMGVSVFDFGTAGYVLTSCGSSAAPVWAAAGGGGVFSICGTCNIVSCLSGNGGTGAYNNFIGMNAGCSNTTGNNNNFIGSWTGIYNTCGIHNNFIGIQVGYFNTSGAYNNFIGGCAGFYNTTGSSNTFIGRNAGRRATTGSNNNVLGRYFMLCMATCDSHSFIGGSSGCNSGITINNCNALAFGGGNGTFDYGTAGYVLTSCGSSAAPVWATVAAAINVCGTNNIVSCLSGNGGTGNNNSIFIGKDAGLSNTTGTYNTIIGYHAGCCNTTGSDNNFIGRLAGFHNTGGYVNSFFGCGAGFCNSSGKFNTFIGAGAGGQNTTGSYNTVIGLYGMAPASNFNHHTFIGGTGSCPGITINNCNAVAFSKVGGYLTYGTAGQVLTSCGSSAAPVWADAGGGGGVFATNGNNVLPYQLSIISCLSNPAGSYAKCSFIVGKYAAPTSSGSDNIIMGTYAGYSITTGSNNILIGQNTGWQGAYGPTPGGLADITTQSDRIILGNSGHTCAQIQIGWTTVSDCRDKHIFGQVPHGRGFLQNIETIEYAFKDRETGCITDPASKRRYGFSAQNVLAAEGDSPVIVSNDNPDKLQLTSDYMVPVLVNAVNELSRELEILKERLALLEAK
jgi:hypothetical protein